MLFAIVFGMEYTIIQRALMHYREIVAITVHASRGRRPKPLSQVGNIQPNLICNAVRIQEVRILTSRTLIWTTLASFEGPFSPLSNEVTIVKNGALDVEIQSPSVCAALQTLEGLILMNLSFPLWYGLRRFGFGDRTKTLCWWFRSVRFARENRELNVTAEPRRTKSLNKCLRARNTKIQNP